MYLLKIVKSVEFILPSWFTSATSGFGRVFSLPSKNLFIYVTSVELTLLSLFKSPYRISTEEVGVGVGTQIAVVTGVGLCVGVGIGVGTQIAVVTGVGLCVGVGVGVGINANVVMYIIPKLRMFLMLSVILLFTDCIGLVAF